MDELTRSDASLPQAEPALTAGAPPPTIKRFFIGDDGLRAGWSLAIFMLLAFALIAAGNAGLRLSHLVPPPTKHVAGEPAALMTPRLSLLTEVTGFTAFALAALLMSLIERRPFRRYGLTTKRFVPDLVTGSFWGIASLSALVGVLLLTHHLAFDQTLLHGQAVAIAGLKWAAVFFFVGLFEEFATRGYIQYTVSRGVAGIARAMNPTFRHTHAVGFWVSALIFSVLIFMAGHLGNRGETLPGILAVGIAGAVFAFSLWRTGSLWWAIGFHTTWDWAQSFLYGVPDSGTMAANRLELTHPAGIDWLSGGPAGPEGSVFVVPTLLAVAAVIYFTLPRRSYFLTPDQRPQQDDPALAAEDSVVARSSI